MFLQCQMTRSLPSVVWVTLFFSPHTAINTLRVRSIFLSTSEDSTKKNPPSVNVCAAARMRKRGDFARTSISLPCIFPPDRSGYSRLYTNASDIQHNVKEVFSTERVSQVRLEEHRTKRDRSLAFSSALALTSAAAPKWDAGYAASPVPLE